MRAFHDDQATTFTQVRLGQINLIVGTRMNSGAQSGITSRRARRETLRTIGSDNELAVVMLMDFPALK